MIYIPVGGFVAVEFSFVESPRKQRGTLRSQCVFICNFIPHNNNQPPM